MKNVRHLVKRCQGAALAGMIVVMTGLPTGTAWAIGPGESGVTSAVTSGGPGGPGVAGGGSGGNTSGNSGSNSGNAAQSANPNAWRKVGGVYQMHDGTPIPNVLHRGIDVSRWQGDVNWRQVAADDVSFVMLGTRSKGAVDPYFHKNIQEAHDAGIQVLFRGL